MLVFTVKNIGGEIGNIVMKKYEVEYLNRSQKSAKLKSTFSDKAQIWKDCTIKTCKNVAIIICCFVEEMYNFQQKINKLMIDKIICNFSTVFNNEKLIFLR